MPHLSDEQILGEPQGRDTLAAVALPAAVLARRDPHATVAVFTADHLIEPVDIFQQRIRTGFELVEQRPELLVTFGITPTHPATGYGYVRLGEPVPGFSETHLAAEFKEKPDAPTAERYVASGDYRWNSGMFVWRALTLLQFVSRYEPDVHGGLMEIADSWETGARHEVLERVYPRLRKISVDYGVLERAAREEAGHIATVSMPVSWLDVGSWPAVAQTIQPDEQDNRSLTVQAMHLDGCQNMVVSDDAQHLVATIGVQDLVVVRTAQATLICRRDQAERIKELHAEIARRLGGAYL
jgi:mannose-1-phosphate guanylyltransferase